MQQNLEEPNDASVVDFDTGIADRTDGDRQRHPLQKREVDVNVEPLGLEASEAAGDDFEGLADGVEIVQSLLSRSGLIGYFKQHISLGSIGLGERQLPISHRANVVLWSSGVIT